VGEELDLAVGLRATLAGRRAVGGEHREGAREKEIPGGDGTAAARVGDDGRHPAPQRGIVEDVVVDQRRHVDELDRGCGADRLRAAATARAEEDEQRSHPLAARGQGLARVGAELAPPPLDGHAEPALDLAHPRRQPGGRQIGHGGDRLRRGGSRQPLIPAGRRSGSR
jgi:hypothetical protein